MNNELVEHTKISFLPIDIFFYIFYLTIFRPYNIFNYKIQLNFYSILNIILNDEYNKKDNTFFTHLCIVCYLFVCFLVGGCWLVPFLKEYNCLNSNIFVLNNFMNVSSSEKVNINIISYRQIRYKCRGLMNL